MSESGNGFGWVVVELKGIWEPRDPGKARVGTQKGLWYEGSTDRRV